MFEVKLSDLGAEMLGWQQYWWDPYNGRIFNKFTVYGVNKEKDDSTSFLLYHNKTNEWKWYPAIYFSL